MPRKVTDKTGKPNGDALQDRTMPRKVTHKTGHPNRDAFISVPVTKGQKIAIIRAAKSLGLDAASYARMCILRDTPYDPERDEELGRPLPEPPDPIAVEFRPAE